MSALAGLAPAFRRCVGELGMWSASTLFLRTARQRGGPDAVAALREALGAEFPVLDVLAEEQAPPRSALPDVLACCAGLERLLVIGLEADCMAPLLAGLAPSTEVILLLGTTFPVDEARVDAAWGAALRRTDLASFQRFAGPRSATLTTVYGSDGFRAAVPRVWVRCHGDDVRTQFARLIGWNVLREPMSRYPRWLVETDVADFTDLLGGG